MIQIQLHENLHENVFPAHWTIQKYFKNFKIF